MTTKSGSKKNLFSSVEEDNLSFIDTDGKKVTYDRIAKFLDFTKKEISQATGVTKESVRYDNKIPQELRRKLDEWLIMFNMVARYFHDNEQKTKLWFKVANPLLGNISPRDLMLAGRYKVLLDFILDALQENEAPDDAGES